MKAIMTFITNYYWIFVILAFVCGISILGYKVQHEKEKTQELGDKVNEQIINNMATETPEENIING